MPDVPATHATASPPDLISVLVVDDHPVFAQSLRAALETVDTMRVVGVAHSAEDALQEAARSQPGVILLDYRLPDAGGGRLIEQLQVVAPGTRVVVLTASADDHTLIDAIESGCASFLTKDQTLEDVVMAVQSAAIGEAVIPPALLARVLPRLRRRGGPSSALTPREREVLELLAAGVPSNEIAERLFVSRNTVRNHVQNVLTKLGAHSRLEAVAIGIREGLVTRA